MNTNFVYTIDRSLYINATNRCTNSCEFCVRNNPNFVYGDLWLEHEPSPDEVLAKLSMYDIKDYDEIVFCGYGEPTYRLDVIEAVSKYAHSHGLKTRINTNGHANAIYKYNVAEEFKNLIDSVSISLNADNEQEYNEICKLNISNAYKSMLDFASSCKQAEFDVSMSIVTGFDNEHNINIESCRQIADVIGAKFRNREFITNGY